MIQNRPLPKNPLATPAEVSAHYGVPERTLTQWRYLGKGPKWSKIGRYVRYRWEDVEAYVKQQARDGRSGT